MTDYDTFDQDYNKANELYETIQSQMSEREKLKVVGKSTTQ